MGALKATVGTALNQILIRTPDYEIFLMRTENIISHLRIIKTLFVFVGIIVRFQRESKNHQYVYFLFQKWNKKKWTLSNARRDCVGLNEFVCGCNQVIRERIFCFHVGFLALDEHVNLDIFLGRQNFQKKRSALYKIWEKGCHLGHYQYIHAQSVYNRPCEKWLFMGEILRSG